MDKSIQDRKDAAFQRKLKYESMLVKIKFKRYLREMIMKTTSQATVVDTTDQTKHPNADTLSVINIMGYNVVGKTSDWEGVTKGIFIPPENLVNTTMPEFAFLHKNREWEKVKVKRLRGFISAGLLIPALVTDNVGDDVTERLRIVHDDPEAKFEGKDQVKPPTGQLSYLPKYDVDSFAKIYKYFANTDEVTVSEKYHGQNMRAVYSTADKKFFVGARGTWQEENGICWSAVRKYPGIQRFCEDNPDFIIAGEVFGQQGGLYNYGLPSKMYEFAAFDIRKPGFQFLDYDDFLSCCSKYGIPVVKELYRGQFTSLDFLKSFAEGQSTFCAKTPREGCVVKTVKEKRAESGDRLIFKIIGSGYNG